MKYMLLMNTPRDGYTQYLSWPKKILEANMAFMGQMAQKLAASGELVSTQGLASPTDAKLVRAGKGGKPITDGVFPESKEFLAGYWLEDVETRERAYEIAAEVSTAPGGPVKGWGREAGRALLDRSARSHERGPRAAVTSSPPHARVERLLRDLAPQVLGTMVRRYRDFASCEDAVQEALIAAADQWPRQGMPEHPRGWLMHVGCGA